MYARRKLKELQARTFQNVLYSWMKYVPIKVCLGLLCRRGEWERFGLGLWESGGEGEGRKKARE